MTWSKPQQTQFLKTKGKYIVDEQDKRVFLGGFNLGNWLLIEPWMLKLNELEGITAGRDIFDLLEKRFGPDKSDQLYKLYLDNFITEEDIQYLAGLGINFIRLPFWYRALFDKRYSNKEMSYLDRAIRWCKKYNLYLLIDFHGAPGGQSNDSGILGEKQQNRLWGDEKYIKELIRMWEKIAEKVKDEPIVAGYDILNEAMGVPDIKTLMELYDRIYKAIRKIDKRHIIYMEDALKGIHRMPRPDSMGWKNVVYSFHYYPGFAAEDDMSRIKQGYQVFLPSLRAAQEYFDVPIHVGEFNSMSMTKGGVEFLRRYMRIFTEYQWPWNIWNYKKIMTDEEDMWGLAGIYTGWKVPDMKVLSFRNMEKLFKSFHTKKLKKNSLYEFMVKNFFSNKKKYTLVRSLYKDGHILIPRNGLLLRKQEHKGIRVNWNRLASSFTSWSSGDSAIWKINIEKDGPYKISLNYGATNNDPGIELLIDNYNYRILNLKETPGDYDGSTNIEIGKVEFQKGPHLLEVKGLSPGEKIMELHSVNVIPIKEKPGMNLLKPSLDHDILLTPLHNIELNRREDLCIEWHNNPPNIGHISDKESFQWEIDSPFEAEYLFSSLFSSPCTNVKMEVYLNEKLTDTIILPDTGEWFKYKEVKGRSVHLRKGLNILKCVMSSPSVEGLGNIRSIQLLKN
ncbi:MAG: cellulase family glycosylhydrolase [Spirochaetes bacterium]|nr:cellulase family glycosylhydrolase [Spirochaetota bacterium]